MEKKRNVTVYLSRLSTLCPEPRVVMLTAVYIHPCIHNLIRREVKRSLVWIHLPYMCLEYAFNVQYAGDKDRRAYSCCVCPVLLLQSLLNCVCFCKTMLIWYFYQTPARKYWNIKLKFSTEKQARIFNHIHPCLCGINLIFGQVEVAAEAKSTPSIQSAIYVIKQHDIYGTGEPLWFLIKL